VARTLDTYDSDMRRLIASLAVLVFALMPAVPATAERLLSPYADSLYSNVLHQQRAIEVRLPEGSKDDDFARCETLYVFDGDWSAKIVVDVVSLCGGRTSSADERIYASLTYMRQWRIIRHDLH
jgi:hypothetical protein